MLRVDSTDIQALVELVRSSTRSSLYARIWGDAHDFESLPSISRADIMATPLSKRRYKETAASVKLVRTDKGLFASEWAFEDLARESWGPIGQRPLVYFADPYEAVEKSLWCYEQNRVPLIGEIIPEVVHSAAAFYQIDSLIADAASLSNLTAYLDTRAEPLEHVVVFGAMFDVAALARYRPYARHMHLVLGLPETGAFARATLEEYPNFTVHDDARVDMVGGNMLLTKSERLVTPIIRYELPDLGGIHLG